MARHQERCGYPGRILRSRAMNMFRYENYDITGQQLINAGLS